jgi:hypothetical protein
MWTKNSIRRYKFLKCKTCNKLLSLKISVFNYTGEGKTLWHVRPNPDIKEEDAGKIQGQNLVVNATARVWEVRYIFFIVFVNEYIA